MTILIVDDDTLLREALQHALPGETRTASTIADGIHEAREWQPAVVVLDMYFDGGRTGLDSIAEFRQACTRSQIVIHTGVFDKAVAREAIDRGAIAYVAKGDLRGLRSAVILARSRVSSSFVFSGSIVH